jgi:hypothetical protein
MRRLKIFLPALFAVGCAGEAYVVTEAPPAARVESVSYRPGYVWVSGHYVRDGRHWRWNNGYYIRDRPNYVYTQPRWERRGRGYVYVEGSWRPRGRVYVERR